MASVVLGAVGGAIGGSGAYAVIGATIGSLIGAAIDNYLLVPALLPEPDGHDAEFGSLKGASADEGAPATYAYGRYNRIACNPILQTTPYSTQSSSSLGKQGEVQTKTWFEDIIYQACWNPIGHFTRFDFDADPVYLANPLFSTSLLFLAPVNFASFFDEVGGVQIHTQINNGTWEIAIWHWVIEAASTGGIGGAPLAFDDLAKFTAGQDLKLSLKNAGGTLVNQGSGPNFSGAVDGEPGSPFRFNPWFRGAENFSIAPPTVVESRVVGTITNAGVSIARTRLVVDLNGFLQWNISNPTGAYSNKTMPTPIPSTHYPFTYNDVFSAWPPPLSGYRLEIEQTGTQWLAGAVEPTPRSAFYTGGGNLAQVDPVYQEARGIPNAPALPGWAFASAKKVNISMRGNRPPIMTAFVDEVNASSATSDDRSLSSMLTTLLVDHARISPAVINTTNLVTDEDAKGLQFRGTTELAKVISPLLVHHDIYVEESDGQIKFRERTQRDTPAIQLEHLDARPFGRPPENELDFSDADQRPMPQRIHLQFLDITKDLQQGDVYDRRDSIGITEFSTRQVRLALSMTDLDAKRTARRLMRDSQVNRRRGKCTLPFWYLHVTETDIALLDGKTVRPGSKGAASGLGSSQFESEDRHLAIERVDLGNDHYVQLQFVELAEFPVAPAASVVLDQPVPGDMAGDSTTTEKLNAPPPVITIPIDIPPIFDEHIGTPGIYIVYASAQESPESSHVLYRDSGGGNWQAVKQAGPSSAVGRVIGKLPTGIRDVIDDSVAFDVEMLTPDHGDSQLATITDDQMNAGENLAAIRAGDGWELIQFKTVTAIEDLHIPSGRRWRLSGLRRGLMGSERFMSAHTDASDWFVLLRPGAPMFLPIDMALVGTTHRYKVVPQGHNAAEGATVPMTVQGYSSLSLPPANLRATRLGNGDVRIDWDQRSRARFRVFGTQAAPLAEITRGYDLVVDPDGQNRTLWTDNETHIYTANMQADDSLTDAEFVLRAYQLDSIRGRGQPAEIIVAATVADSLDESGATRLLEDGRTRTTEC